MTPSPRPRRPTPSRRYKSTCFTGTNVLAYWYKITNSLINESINFRVCAQYVPRDYFRFELIHQSKISNARVGRIHTPHGTIDTPGYVPVATTGAQKAVDHRLMDELAGTQFTIA